MIESTKPLLRFFALILPVAMFIVISCNEDNQVPITTIQQGDMPQYSVDSIDPGDFKTFGQGGWGSPPHGGNPGVYLRDHWDLLDTVIIGCDSTNGHTLTFTSSQAIMHFLPQGRTPAALDSSYVNPDWKITVLAGQVLALALNIGFDLADSSFGASNEHLEDLCAQYGTFTGWTVAEIFAEANLILGGCYSEYSPSEVNEACTRINENFEGGTVVGNFLDFCPTSNTKRLR